MEIAGDTRLEFLDLKLKISEDKIRVEISSEYQTYSIATDHEPSIVKKQFSEVEKI